MANYKEENLKKASYKSEMNNVMRCYVMRKEIYGNV